MNASDQSIDAPSALKTHLAELPKDWHALHYTILADGTLAVLIADVDFSPEWKRIVDAQGALDPPSRILAMADAGKARLLIWHDEGWQEGPCFPLEAPHPIFDRFTDGRWLIVASRTIGTPNARMLSHDGVLAARFMLGDGIEHLGIDGADQIWVGWFD